MSPFSVCVPTSQVCIPGLHLPALGNISLQLNCDVMKPRICITDVDGFQSMKCSLLKLQAGLNKQCKTSNMYFSPQINVMRESVGKGFYLYLIDYMKKK